MKANRTINAIKIFLTTEFSFNKMIELEVPESVADFIQGRVPRRVGAKHYMALARQASKFYPRYLEYIEGLRRG